MRRLFSFITLIARSWTCSRCGTVNPDNRDTCKNCGEY